MKPGHKKKKNEWFPIKTRVVPDNPLNFNYENQSKRIETELTPEFSVRKICTQHLSSADLYVL